MLSRKSTIIATIFIAFMYLVFVPLVYAATEYKMADYWPFKEGAWWEFNDGKIEITGTEEINGINTFKYLDSGSCLKMRKLREVVNSIILMMMPMGFGSFQDEDEAYYGKNQ